jgi:hypothetical protein
LFNDLIAGLDDPSMSGALAMFFGMQDPNFKEFFVATIKTAGHRFAILQATGWFALVLETAQRDDWICIFRGASIPYVIRRVSPQHFALVGPCFVHGMRDGKMFEEGQAMSKLRKITLI